MSKSILITGATDGIGLETARSLFEQGHRVIVHGRSQEKLERVAMILSGLPGEGLLDTVCADLSRMEEVDRMAAEILADPKPLDVLINNAGVLKAPADKTVDGLDVRFAVNTLAPYRLTRLLLPKLPPDGRVVNLSSAAQAPVDLAALAGVGDLDDMEAYAQSKLALTMWTRQMADELGASGPVVVAVNPGSLLASKMVKEGFGIAGNDLSIGAKILELAATGEEFADASGKYFDNDARRFGPPHRDAQNPDKCAQIMKAIDEKLAEIVA